MRSFFNSDIYADKNNKSILLSSSVAETVNQPLLLNADKLNAAKSNAVYVKTFNARKVILVLIVLLLLPFMFISCIEEGDLAIQQGSSLFQKKKFMEAEKYFQLALTQECSYPKDTIYIYISNCYSQSGDYDTAIEYRKKALEISEDATNYLNLGFLYRLKSDDETAEQMYIKALKLLPQSAAAYASLGSLYLTHNRIDEAIDMLEHSLDCDNKSGIVHADLAVCYARKGRFQEAEEEYQYALQYKCDNLDQFRKELDELIQ